MRMTNEHVIDHGLSLYEREYCTAVRPNRPHGSMRPTSLGLVYISSEARSTPLSSYLPVCARGAEVDMPPVEAQVPVRAREPKLNPKP
jgi:hypothetical protein